MAKVLALCSGGIDSTTMVADLLFQEHEVVLLSIKYPTLHNPSELRAFESIREHYGLDVVRADLTQVFESQLHASALFRGDVPDGHYSQESIKQTVVPGRNLIFLSIAASIAEANGFQYVAYGAHFDDHAVYPDCRYEFVMAAKLTIYLSSDGKVDLLAPWVNVTKADIVARGAELGVPFHLTWSCYKGGDIHCGTCSTCLARKEAFVQAGVTDPTVYKE